MARPPVKLGTQVALALSTLTVLRVPVRAAVGVDDLRASLAWYPLVGALVGAVPALLLLAPLPPGPRAALALGGWVAISGALHLDGWADCCDGAFAPNRTREQRLAILKDPHLGTFGAVGLLLLLLAKWTALVHLAAAAPLLAASAGRWVMVWALRSYPPAREDGLAAALAGPVPLGLASLALAPVVVVVARSVAPGVVIAMGIAGVLAGAGAASFLARRFGGVTGDVCGAAGEAAEVAALWAALPWLGEAAARGLAPR